MPKRAVGAAVSGIASGLLAGAGAVVALVGGAVSYFSWLLYDHANNTSGRMGAFVGIGLIGVMVGVPLAGVGLVAAGGGLVASLLTARAVGSGRRRVPEAGTDTGAEVPPQRGR